MSWRIPFYPDVGLLLIRLALSGVFMIHGFMKWQNLTKTMEFFSSLGLPETVVYLVIATEFFAGLMILFGWLTRVSSFALVVVMAFAIILVNFPKGFVGGYEYDSVLLIMSLALMLAGPGKYKLKVVDSSNQPL